MSHLGKLSVAKLTIGLSLMLTMPNIAPAQAAPPTAPEATIPALQEQAKACERVVAKCDLALSEAKSHINDQKDVMDDLRVSNQALRQDNGSILKNPLFWFVVGGAVGFGVGK